MRGRAEKGGGRRRAYGVNGSCFALKKRYT